MYNNEILLLENNSVCMFAFFNTNLLMDDVGSIS